LDATKGIYGAADAADFNPQNMRINMKKIVVICGTLLISSNVFAQAENRPSDRVSIEEIVSSYSSSSGEKVLLDPRVKARVTLYGQSLQELSYDALTTILRIHNFASFRSGGFLVIVPLNVIKQQSIELVNQEHDYVANQIVNDIIQMDKLCPNDLVPLLRPLVPPSAHFGVLHQPRILFITDTYENIKRIREIVERLDSQLQKRQTCDQPKK
jgi:type II secretory pathway component GspD/PulD (secretin)